MMYGNADALREAILDQAERDRQRLIHEAESQAQRIITQAQMAVSSQRAHITENAALIAADLQRETKGSARLEAQAIKVRKREALLEEVFSRAAERLAELDQHENYGEVVANLVLDGARQLGQHGDETSPIVILVDDVARRLLDAAVLERLEKEAGRKISLGGPLPRDAGSLRPVGVIVQSEDGRLRYDNTLQARLNRMRGTLRASAFRVLMGESI
jgi:V/A-type H+/Na+-transporting ATPase subunit E